MSALYCNTINYIHKISHKPTVIYNTNQLKLWLTKQVYFKFHIFITFHAIGLNTKHMSPRFICMILLYSVPEIEPLLPRQICPSSSIIHRFLYWYHPGIILWMCSTSERRRYIVMSSLIGWAHTQNNPCITQYKLRWAVCVLCYYHIAKRNTHISL